MRLASRYRHRPGLGYGWPDLQLVGRSILPTGGFTAVQRLAVVAVGVIGGYGGFRMILKANQIGTTGQVSMVAFVLPVLGVLGGRILFDEPSQPAFWSVAY